MIGALVRSVAKRESWSILFNGNGGTVPCNVADMFARGGSFGIYFHFAQGNELILCLSDVYLLLVSLYLCRCVGVHVRIGQPLSAAGDTRD